MNYWTKLSCEFAQQRNYLDELFKVYPITPNIRRELPEQMEQEINHHFSERNNAELIKTLLKNDIFPLKDGYVAFLKRDSGSIDRNPATVDRIAGNLYSMGIDKIIENCTAPKETNRQMGPAFKNWIDKKYIGVPIINDGMEFLNYQGNCVFNSSDDKMQKFAQEYLGFVRNKGIDFMGKFNNKYIIGEAKFLTDFGGHQNAQFNDAISTLKGFDTSTKTVSNEVIPIAILDGVLYINGRNKMYKAIQQDEYNILSALVLREFLFSL